MDDPVSGLVPVGRSILDGAVGVFVLETTPLLGLAVLGFSTLRLKIAEAPFFP
jgi:hypothetical protein